MIILGIILAILPYVLPVPAVLATIGWILILLGAILWFAPTFTGRPFGPGIYRGRYW